MTVPVNTFGTYQAIGNREDLVDTIYNVSPEDTPFTSMAAKNQATSKKHEWQTDQLEAATADNAHLEGDEAAADPITPTVRLYNDTQILRKVPYITGTQEDGVNPAGRSSEMNYQVAKRAIEIKTDLESSALANQASVSGNATTARRMAGAPAWLATNTNAGTGGGDPTGDGSDARTPGTPRAITEAMLQDVKKQIFEAGGKPNYVLAGAYNRQQISGFTGGNSIEEMAPTKKITAVVDIYEDDFGAVRIVPDLFQPPEMVFVMDMSYWALAYNRNMRTYDLAKTGDNYKKMLICEVTVEARNERSSGIIADLTTSAGT